VDQRVAVEHGHGGDQVLDLVRCQHGGERSFLTRKNVGADAAGG
jgi:hypothetical protein